MSRMTMKVLFGLLFMGTALFSMERNIERHESNIRKLEQDLEWAEVKVPTNVAGIPYYVLKITWLEKEISRQNKELAILQEEQRKDRARL